VGIRQVRATQFAEIMGEFNQSSNPRDKLVAEEMRDAMEWYGDGTKAIGDSIDRMDELIRAARLARTKLRRLL
jgi:hypothetical protein